MLVQEQPAERPAEGSAAARGACRRGGGGEGRNQRGQRRGARNATFMPRASHAPVLYKSVFVGWSSALRRCSLPIAPMPRNALMVPCVEGR